MRDCDREALLGIVPRKRGRDRPMENPGRSIVVFGLGGVFSLMRGPISHR
jgi:hypothetical protein